MLHERCVQQLSDEELMLAIIGAGAKRCMNRVEERDLEPLPLSACLIKDYEELGSRYDLTRSQARRTVLLGECHRRLLKAMVPENPSVRQPEDVLDIMRPHILGRETEAFWVLSLNVRGGLIGTPVLISTGDVDGTDAGPRGILRAVLRRGAVSAVVVHNHPSGDPSPSQADIAVTQRLVTAGIAVDVVISDHVIISSDGRLFSLRRERPRLFQGVTGNES